MASEVDEGPKIELLRALVEWEDVCRPFLRDRAGIEASEYTALGGHTLPPGIDFKSEWGDIKLAAREASAVGLIEIANQCDSPMDWECRITEAGRRWLAVHDLSRAPSAQGEGT